MPDLPPLDPVTGGIAALSASVATAVAAAVGKARGKGGLSDEDRALLQGISAQLGELQEAFEAHLRDGKALRGQVSTLSADVAAMREEGGQDRGRVVEIRTVLGGLLEEVRPILRGWERDQERARTIEEGADARGRRLEEVERQVKAVHGRLDALTQQLREQLPQALGERMKALTTTIGALEHSVAVRFPRRDP